ncbi:hypothetical protein, partial [Pseudotabrizicola sp.]|uniref:hypothetical protein n=1 Tax=Pseudotabrizicola sp. TaxID=2939647 RepID=UPI0027293633
HPVALGEKGFKPSHLLVSQPVEVAHGSVSLRSLNHANNLKSMGLEPKLQGGPNALGNAGGLYHPNTGHSALGRALQRMWRHLQQDDQPVEDPTIQRNL